MILPIAAYRPLALNLGVTPINSFSRASADLFLQRAAPRFQRLTAVHSFRLPIVARKAFLGGKTPDTDVEEDTGWILPTPDGKGVIIFPELPITEEIPIIPQREKPEIQDEGRTPLYIDDTPPQDYDEDPTEEYEDDQPIDRGTTIIDYKI
ncbi:MAG: hypothetical protein ABII18_09940 [bacterium]|nr:hypothetical protein [bacterium]MBU1917670.1 hypothetical protein [bacterium]